MTPASRRKTGSSNSTILVYLSLFMLLLVFFLVINANAHEKTYRVKAVLTSLERRFGPMLLTSNRVGGDTIIAGRVLRTYGELFETELAIAKVEQVNKGGHMVVTVPEEELITPDGHHLRPERQGLMDRIARSLRDRAGPLRVTLDVLLHLGNEATGSGDPVARAAVMGRVLLADGAPPESVSVGLEPGPSGMVRFLFAIVPDDEVPRPDEEPSHGHP